LQLAYRPPYDWQGILAFLKARELKGVEWVTDDFYARTVRLGKAKGWIKITSAKNKNALLMEFSHSLTPVLPALLNRVRDLFDLNAAVKKNPGLRVPGAFHGFEIGIRAILGQQITVKGATTLAARFALAFGEKISTPFPELNRLTPSPTRVAKANVDQIAKLGIIRARAKSIIALAEA
jgi:AraC family transcriptional regulator, regulatory protein of adaptative response / DNA-3-methyladenine glycosylase II